MPAKLSVDIRKIKSALFSILLIIFILVSNMCFYMDSFSEEQPYQVLIINSYHEGFMWTDDFTSAVVKKLKSFEKPVDIYTQHLDWKRFQSQSLLNNIASMLEEKYRDVSLDMVVVSDDAALTFVIQNRERLFPETPIVFGGVLKNVTDKLLYNVDNVTGVYEEVDPDGTLDIALSVNPDIKNIFVFHDNFESGISTLKSLRAALKKKSSDAALIDLSGKSSSQIDDVLSNAKDDSIAIILSLYLKIDGSVVEPFDFGGFLSKYDVPVYSLYQYNLGSGIVGGSLIGGQSHGNAVGEICVKILSGVNIKQMPISSELTVVHSFDVNALNRFDIDRNFLPKDSTYINEPFSFFKTYKTLVLSTLFVIGVLLILIIQLIRSNIAKAKAEVTIKQNHEELTQTYEELTATHDELTCINEELIASQDELKVHIKKLEEEKSRNYRLAYYDSLTGLPNRTLLKEVAESAIIQANKNSIRIGLYFIDIDNFKLINDSFGHFLGDEILLQTGKRIINATSENGLAARLGGDEFVVIEELSNNDDPSELARHLLKVFENPVVVMDNTFYLSISIGVVLYPDHGITYDELLKNADTSMYCSKDAGKGRFTMFSSQMNEEIVKRTNLQQMIRNAISEKEFVLYYQPKYDATTGIMIGMEALCRWIRADGEIIPPDKFIPIAEETGLIIPLGEYALHEACNFIQNLKSEGISTVPVSINVSVVQLANTDMVKTVTDIIKHYNLQPSDIELEITESVLMESFETNINQLQALSNAGISIALDDFGTGYSSLTYLTRLPLKVLKIDKSFIKNLSVEKNQIGIIRAIISLAEQFDLQVVAEGVETISQSQSLVDVGCKLQQGYYFSRPCSEAVISDVLRKKPLDV